MTLSSVSFAQGFACPLCACATLIKSRQRGVSEQIISVLRFRPFRCDDCGHRFYAREPDYGLRAVQRACHA